mmetsp:Transcript_31388/g.66851  ORF Transcript_31388/g.66851 Transcript_31388/m.66851 type:complete len:375 (-) Transcript_31388:192-1316(-)
MPILHCSCILFYALLPLSSLGRSVVEACFIVRNPMPVGRKLRIKTLPSSYLRLSAPDDDLWDADGPLQKVWASSLPLPENAGHDPSIADRARNAMAGSHPAALEGRCDVDLGAFDGRVKWLHVDPPVMIVDGFLTDAECDEVLRLTDVSPPPFVGRVIRIESRLSESNKSSSTSSTVLRLSTTWYVRYAAAALSPLLRGLRKLLPNVALERVEEVQLVRYEGEGQGFGWHEDVLGIDQATPEAGGQRVATLLVYLDECDDGRTLFRDLQGEDDKRLGVSPKRGRALLFFPSLTGTTALGEAASMADGNSQRRKTFGDTYFDGTRADHRTTHAGEPPTGNRNKGQKHIAQLWIHSREHTPVVFGRGLNRHAEATL